MEKGEMKNLTDIWGSFPLEQGKQYSMQIGPLKIWLRREGDEWFLTSDLSPDEFSLSFPHVASNLEQKIPKKSVWRRIIAVSDSDYLTIRPVMDEKPIVVGAEAPLSILPHNEALVFVNVPLRVRLYAGTGSTLLLGEIPTVLLSNTWLGEPVSGQLCLALKTSAVRKREFLTEKPNRAGCPVMIINQSDEPLELEKLCIHSENLELYKGGCRLWSNKVAIHYFGQGKESEISRIKGAPGMEENEELFSPPRIHSKNSIFQKSFEIFKQITVS